MTKKMNASFQIGELARRCGVTPDTIRYYERRGLLPRPRRAPSRYRMYGPEDAARMRFIRDAQAIGLTLEDIGELMRQRRLHNPGECRRVAALLRQRIGVIERRLAELRAFRRRLLDSLDRCEAAGNDSCPVMLDLAGIGEHGAGEVSR
jgi:DNA-binding transcriptional MerR regulator